MKWAIFALGLAAVIPFIAWLRQNPRHFPKVLMAIGALPYVMGGFPKYEIAIYGVPDWYGFTQGFDISVIDLIVLCAYFTLPRGRTTLPFKFSFACYIGAILVSAFQAPVPIATSYYAWQLMRMFMVYAVIAKACEDLPNTVSVLKGMALGLCFQASVVLWQRFVLHYLFVTGTYPHQNTLGLVTHFVVFPFFALLLSGQNGWWPAVVPVIGMAVDVITSSRASLGLAAAGFSFLFFISTLRKWTARKARILAAAVLVLALLSPLAYRQFELRFNALGDPQYGRQELNDAAELILFENPMGIGANNFVVVANVRGYYARTGVGDLNRVVPHNIYWTTAAETGFFGFACFIVFLFRPLFVALSCGWRNRKDPRGDLLLGLATSLIVVYVHSYFEWTFFHDLVQYLLAINIGIIAGLAQQLGYWSKRPSRTSLRSDANDSRLTTPA